MISASILSCNLGSLSSEIVHLQLDGADMIHFDLSDGHFIPLLSFGYPVLHIVRSYTTLPIEVHLMVQNPLSHIDRLVDYGINKIIIHPETVSNLKSAIDYIKNKNIQVGIALSPSISFDEIAGCLKHVDSLLLLSSEPECNDHSFTSDTIKRIQEVVTYKMNENLHDLSIGVDGGITDESAQKCWDEQIDYLVAGTFLFRNKNKRESICALKRKMESEPVNR